MQAWFSGSSRPDQRYQGENTEPMNPMTLRPRLRGPSSSASRYHQA